MKTLRFAARFALLFGLALPVAAKAAAPKPPAPSPEAAATVVVFNTADAASASLAASYAEKRGIPYDHLIPVTAPVTETISRADYDRCLAGPLRETFVGRGWWKGAGEPLVVSESAIRYVALMRGVPLRIARAAGPVPGDSPERLPPPLRPNEASVDSELAALGLGLRQISGPVENPYYQRATRIGDANAPGLLLVCRLDAPTPATVQRMMADSILAERTGLWGFAYVDSRGITGGAMAEGDAWFRAAAGDLLRGGMPCIHENTPQLFADGYPMRYAALYFGWYSEQVAGPFKDARFRFVPGAVAVHLHSFSAATLREPLRNWCGPLLERGAAATLGNVYEPYLGLTPNLEVFEERLRSGFTFAEAAYASQKVLSWMTTFVGDPLYRPFAPEAMKAPPKSAREWAAFRDGVRLWFDKDRAAGEAFLKARARELKSGVVWESLACLQLWVRDPEAASASLGQARECYADGADQVRCALNNAALLFTTGKKKAALALARQQLKATPEAGGAGLLRGLVNRLDPPPAPAAQARP